MAAPIRVLCVDDEADLAALVAQHLNDNADDMEATMATDGESALATLAAERVDCVVSDYQMPNMDGLELLETIRSTHADLPFILFTGRGNEELAGEAVRAGVSDYIPKSTGTDQYTLLENRIRNVVERRQARQTTRELFNAATDAILIHDPASGTIVDANDAALELWGASEGELLECMPGELAADAQTESAWLPGGEETTTGPTDWECETVSGGRFWAEIRVQHARIDGGDQLLSVCRDISRRKRREQRLGRLMSSARELMAERDLEGVGNVVTRTMTNTLGYQGAIMYVSSEEGLTAVGHAGEVGADVEDPEFESEAERLLGDSDGPLRHDGGTRVEATGAIQEGRLVYWSLDDDGVLVGNPPEGHVSGFTHDLTDLLVSITKAAVSRTLTDRALASQHEELASLNHMNEVIRDINQTLVKVSTRDEIEQLVPKQLAAASPFVCAWIGEHNLTAETVDIRVAAGHGAAAAREDVISTEEDTDDPLGQRIKRAIADRNVVIIDTLTPETVGEERAALAQDHEYESLTIIPITYQNALYDLLAIYAEEAHPFGTDERAVLGELGETIGYAMHTAERSRALLSDTTVELEYEIRDDENIILGLSQALETTVELERIFFSADDSARLFVKVEDGRLPSIRKHVKERYTDATVREISRRENAIIVEISVPSLAMMKHLAEAMATIRSAEATTGEGRLVVEIPNAVSVRTLTENLEMVFDHVSLLARRQCDPEDKVLSDMSDASDMGLTDRQHEVLLTAYHAGFFSWPRESTGEEIAELLDISQPTFHEHLRTGERKLLELLFANRRSVYT